MFYLLPLVCSFFFYGLLSIISPSVPLSVGSKCVVGECRHEKDGGVGEEGLEDPGVPAGDEPKEKAGEKLGCQDCC